MAEPRGAGADFAQPSHYPASKEALLSEGELQVMLDVQGLQTIATLPPSLPAAPHEPRGGAVPGHAVPGLHDVGSVAALSEGLGLMQQRIARLEDGMLMLSLPLQSTQSQAATSNQRALAAAADVQPRGVAGTEQQLDSHAASADQGRGSAKTELASMIVELQQYHTNEDSDQCDTGSSTQSVGTHELSVSARLDAIKGLLEKDAIMANSAKQPVQLDEELERRIAALAIAEATKALRGQWGAEAARGATRLDAVETRVEAVASRFERELGSSMEMAEALRGSTPQQPINRLSEWLLTFDGHVGDLGLAIQETSNSLSRAVEMLQEGVDGLKDEHAGTRRGLECVQAQLDSMQPATSESQWGAEAVAVAEAARQAANAIAAESVEAARLGEVARAELRRTVDDMWQALDSVRQEMQERYHALANKMESGLQRLVHKLDERVPPSATHMEVCSVTTTVPASGATAMVASSGLTSTCAPGTGEGRDLQEGSAELGAPAQVAARMMPLQAHMPKTLPENTAGQRCLGMQPLGDPATPACPHKPAQASGAPATPPPPGPPCQFGSPMILPRASSPAPVRRLVTSPPEARPRGSSPSPVVREATSPTPLTRTIHSSSVPQLRPSAEGRLALGLKSRSQRSLSPAGGGGCLHSDARGCSLDPTSRDTETPSRPQGLGAGEREGFISEIRKIQNFNETLLEEIARRDQALLHLQKPQQQQQQHAAPQLFQLVQPALAFGPHASPPPQRRALASSPSKSTTLPVHSPVLMPRTPQQKSRLTHQSPNPVVMHARS